MVTCARCAQDNPEGFRFCGACGAPLDEQAADKREERKVVTIVFCDMVGSTARAETLDPEDVEAILAPYHHHVRSELERFGGTVEKFIGDAVMAVFGAPTAHEDDAERAVRAALSIRDWVRETGDIQLRIGVNTGEALVSLDARAEQGESLVKGDVVNTAARLEAAAPIDGVLVGDATYRATREGIEYGPHEDVHAKGKAQPVPVWEAVGLLVPAEHADGRQPKVPFIGREWELDQLKSTLRRVRQESAPQLVTLVGVPGIGKSRLISEFRESVDTGPGLIRWRQGRSLPYGDGVAFWALGEVVKTDAGILASDSAEDAGAKLRSRIAELAPDAEEGQWLEMSLRPLIGLSGADSGSTGAGRSIAWRRFLELLAELEPLVLVIEDLHWADEALLDFIDDLADSTSNVPLLILATARPELLERRPGWGGGKLNAASISLSPLPDDATARIVSAVLEGSVAATIEQQPLLAKIGGNPLYAEQYARATLERGDVAALPETVHGIIAARLDALSPQEKSLLQDAAVVGNVFWLGAVETVADRPGSDLSEVLHRLERKQFVERARRSSVAGEAEYAFRHVLLRDVAYGEIPRLRRAEKHRRAATWLESLGRADDHADMLADHYLEALRYTRAAGKEDPGLAEQAEAIVRVAGDRAVSLAAYRTAVRFYEAALELSPGNPDLLLRLGRTRFSADSSGIAELQAAYDAFLAADDPESAAEAALGLRMIAWYQADGDGVRRWLDEALALVRPRSDSRAKAMALATLAGNHQINAENRETIRTGHAALEIIDRLGLEDLRSQVLLSVGTARASVGEAAGLDDIDRALRLARGAGDMARVHACLNNLSGMQALFGRVEDAARTYEELSDSVERYGRDTDRRWAREELGVIRAGQGRWDEALTLLDGFIAEVESGSPHYLEPSARATRAAIRLARGQLAGASEDTERALDGARVAKDAQLLVPVLVARANNLLAAGRRTEAGELVDEALGLPQAVATLGAELIELVWIAWNFGRQPQLLAALEQAPDFPWVVAGRSIANGDFERATTVLADVNSPPVLAYTDLRTAEELTRGGRASAAKPHLQRALHFYISVGATRFIAEAEALGG